MYGFYKVAAAVPKLIIADIEYNTKEILFCMKKINNNNAIIGVFPELCITGYSCEDLFYQNTFLEKALISLKDITKYSTNLKTIFAIGLPMLINNNIYNCVAIIYNGKILGINTRTEGLDSSNNSNDNKWFSKSPEENILINIDSNINYPIIFGDKLLFNVDNDFKFSITINRNYYNIFPINILHILSGATILINPSAEISDFDNSKLIKESIIDESKKYICGYIYSSTSSCESSSKVVYNGKSMILENGNICSENKKFLQENSIIFSDIDFNKINNLKTSNKFFNKNSILIQKYQNELLKYKKIEIKISNRLNNINRNFSKTPFLSEDKYIFHDNKCKEIFNIQIIALANRIKYINAKKTIIGVSGGIDSTLALLITRSAHIFLGKPISDIIAVTMPSFGTTIKPYKNILFLCKLINCTIINKNIKNICMRQFKLLNINLSIKSNVYENIQARQRTAILMNIANKENGFVVGTNNMSELALGWTTYCGDHMSMYCINCGITKTMIFKIVEWYINNKIISNKKINNILEKIIDFPISPELLPPNKDGTTSQITEKIIGPYELHDFFLYHMIINNFSIEKIIFLATITFKNKYLEKDIKKYITIFIERIFSQQYKRNCLPDGPRVNYFDLSNDKLKIPSDASCKVWKSTVININ